MAQTTLRTRGQFITAAQNFIQNTSTTVATIVRDAIDWAYQDVLRRHTWPHLITWEDSAATAAAGAAYVYLPKDVDRLIDLIDASNELNLDQYIIRNLVNRTYGNATLQGQPVEYAWAGTFGTKEALAANTAMEVVSSAADTRLGWVKGNLNGEQKQDNFTLAGAVPVAVGSWDEITEFTLETTGAQTVTLRTVSGSTTKGTIAPYELSAAYRRYRLRPVADTTITVRAVYSRIPEPIYDDGQQYPIPIDTYLYHVAIAAAYQYKRNTRQAEFHQALAERALQQTLAGFEVGRIHIASPHPRTKLSNRVW